jgi:putative intracellular protease/amidase
MKTKLMLWSGVGLGLVGAAGATWLLSLPPAPAKSVPPAIGKDEADAILAGLKPPKRARPVIAIVGINHATELTDYLMPYGILRRANLADVMLLSTERGPVELFPALRVVCAGAKVVASTGLLDGKRATTHWYYLKELRRKHPNINYVADRRIVVDNGVATTTGISASMPMALTLIEAIAGHETAAAVADEIGLPQWDARHDSRAFQFSRPFAATAISNSMAFWKREELGIELMPDVDEVSLALVSDAWSRTYRSHAFTFARDNTPLQTRNGVRVIPDRILADPAEHLVPAPGTQQQPATALDDALGAIAIRYGLPTAHFVAMQLEYPAGLN